MAEKHTHPSINQAHEDHCKCHGSYFYGRLPCVETTHIIGNTSVNLGFLDAQYLKTNTGPSAVYGIDVDGALIIYEPGTYSVDLTTSLNIVEGLTGPAITSLAVYVETYTGYSPFTQQQMQVMVEPITADDLSIGQKLIHSNAVIHVGDPLYGIGIAPARVYLVLSVHGVTCVPDVEVTIRS